MFSTRIRPLLTASVLTFLAATVLMAVPSRASDFDADWVRFFAQDTVAYVAVRGAIGEGPLVKKTLASQAPIQMATNSQGGAGQLAIVVSDLTTLAKKQKVISVYLGELASKGFALGGTLPPEGQHEADGLIVVARTPELDKFWPTAVDHLKTTRPKGSVKDLTINGMSGIVMTGATDTQPLCFLMAKNDLLVGTSEAILKAALDRFAKNAPSLATVAYYQRVRPSVPRDALAFMAMDPAPVLDRAASTETDPMKKDKLTQLKGRIEALLGSFILSPKCLRADLLAFLPVKATGPKAVSMLRDHAMVVPTDVAQDSGIYIGLSRPGDDVMNQVVQGLGGMLSTAKGLAQSNFGLDFDQDVAPWWGDEIGIVADVSGPVPEGALVMDVTNRDAAGKAMAKVERHLAVTKGLQFEAKTVDGTPMKASKVENPPQSPINPALALLKDAVAVGTSSHAIEALAHKGKKLMEDAAFRELERVLSTKQMAVLIYVRSALIATLIKKSQNAQGGAPGLPIPSRSLALPGGAAQADAVASGIEQQVNAFLLAAGQPAPDRVLLTLVVTGP